MTSFDNNHEVYEEEEQPEPVQTFHNVFLGVVVGAAVLALLSAVGVAYATWDNQ